uniref:Uncharacterized protein n=1 Tax=Physcomitrium patens TaxID=3218 RepID=A0A2K1KUF0_PHYPA|nr:hypothetical protein PHYPA_004395 [Physcomitrium patens]
MAGAVSSGKAWRIRAFLCVGIRSAGVRVCGRTDWHWYDDLAPYSGFRANCYDDLPTPTAIDRPKIVWPRCARSTRVTAAASTRPAHQSSALTDLSLSRSQSLPHSPVSLYW